jgi:hypothetical protein
MKILVPYRNKVAVEQIRARKMNFGMLRGCRVNVSMVKETF